MMERSVKLLRSPFEMFIIVTISIVLIITILFGLVTFSKGGATMGFFVGLMIGVPLGVAAGFWQAIENSKTISKMKNQQYFVLRRR